MDSSRTLSLRKTPPPPPSAFIPSTSSGRALLPCLCPPPLRISGGPYIVRIEGAGCGAGRRLSDGATDPFMTRTALPLTRREPSTPPHLRGGLVLLALATLFAPGCASIRTTDPPRTASEQFLLSQA